MAESYIRCVVLWSCPFQILVGPCRNVEVWIDVDLRFVHHQLTSGVGRSIQCLKVFGYVGSDSVSLRVGAEGYQRL